MAFQKPAYVAEKKRAGRKRKARTEVSSSSESDTVSDVSTKKSKKPAAVVEKKEVKDVSSSESSPAPAPVPAKKEKKEKKKKSKATTPTPETNGDVSMDDAPSPPRVASTKFDPKASAEDFRALYLRKLAVEFADDLDKVREAPDFKASSVPMLVHALKQGESLFTAGERRRVAGAASA